MIRQLQAQIAKAPEIIELLNRVGTEQALDDAHRIIRGWHTVNIEILRKGLKHAEWAEEYELNTGGGLMLHDPGWPERRRWAVEGVKSSMSHAIGVVMAAAVPKANRPCELSASAR